MKYLMYLIAALATANASHAQNPKSQIQVHQLRDGRHVVVVWSIISKSIEAARQEALPEAKRICGARSIHFDEPQFDEGGKNGPSMLMQPIDCIDVTAAPTTVVNDPKWRPTERQQAIILELTRRYFRLKDAGEYEQLRQFLVPQLSAADVLAAAEKFNKQAGEVRYRKLDRVTWYTNMPNAFAPGLFTAVDFFGQLANADIYCGFVIWYRGEDGMTKLLRDEQNLISIRGQRQMPASELAAMRKEMRC